MKVRVLFFAAMADAAGVRTGDLELPAGASVGDAIDAVFVRYSALKPFATSMAVAVNERYAARTMVLEEDDVLALIPPVSGG